jgi:uncharacterized protein
MGFWGFVSHGLSRRFIQFLVSAVCLMFWSGFGSSAIAASFSCAKARHGVEQAICLDPELSKLDEEMATAYRAVLANTTSVELTKQSQRDWLRFSRNSCASLDCLRVAYEQRINALKSGSSGDLKFAGGIGQVYASLDSLPTGLSYGPGSAAQKPYIAWLQQSRFLETVAESFASISTIPSNLRITARECGEPNAVYFGSKNSVVLCYELVQELAKAHIKRVADSSADATIEGRRLIQGLRFAVFHELGHAIFKWNENQGLLGREETAADSVAAVLLLKDLSNEQAVNDALWGVWTEFQLFKIVSVQHPSDEHEYSDQRLYNFTCMLGGKAPTFIPRLIQSNLLTLPRSKRCDREWKAAYLGVKTIAQKAVSAR